MTPGIDFSELSLRDALDLAILVEQEARERYEELADQMTIRGNDDAARFFLRMLQVELSHERILTSRRKALFGDQPRTVKRGMIFDVEAPTQDGKRTTMTARQAMEMALGAETKAHAFFDGSLREIRNPEVLDFFTQLRNEEREHQRLVEAQMAMLGPEP